MAAGDIGGTLLLSFFFSFSSHGCIKHKWFSGTFFVVAKFAIHKATYVGVTPACAEASLKCCTKFVYITFSEVALC